MQLHSKHLLLCIFLILCIPMLVIGQSLDELLEKGSNYEETEEYQKAEAVYKEVIKKYKKEDAGYLSLGTLYLRQENPKSAISQLEKAHKRSPKKPLAPILLSFSHYLVGNAKMAHQYSDIAIKLAPENAPVYYIRGLITLYMDKDTSTALSNLNLSIVLKEDYVEPRVLRCKVLLELNKNRLALADADFLIAQNPNHFEAYDLRIRVAQRLDSLDLLEKDLIVLQNLDEKVQENARFMYLKSVVDVKRERYSKAIVRLNQLISKHPDNVYDAFLFLGMAYAYLGETQNAIDKLTKFFKEYAFDLNDVRMARVAMLSLADKTQAVQLFDKLGELWPKSLMILESRIVTRLENEMYESALELLATTEENQPEIQKISVFLKYRVLALSRLKNFKEAVRFQEKLVALEPNMLSHQNYLGYLLIQDMRWEEGVDLLTRVLKEATTGIQYVYCNRCLGYLRMNVLVAAEQDCMEALRLDPDSEQALLYLGDIMHIKGQAALACEYWQKSKSISPIFFERQASTTAKACQ